MTDYEELEARRLDLAERELAMKESLAEREVAKYEQDVDDQIADRKVRELEREVERAATIEDRQRVHDQLDRHEALLERMADALEIMARKWS